jgi:hypothetical protein
LDVDAQATTFSTPFYYPVLPQWTSLQRPVKAMFSGFAELGRSLFAGVAQILHGRIDTGFYLLPRICAGRTQLL